MRYHGSKLGFRTIVREYQGPGYRTTQLRWDGINQNYNEQIKCFVKLIALTERGEAETSTDNEPRPRAQTVSQSDHACSSRVEYLVNASQHRFTFVDRLFCYGDMVAYLGGNLVKRSIVKGNESLASQTIVMGSGL